MSDRFSLNGQVALVTGSSRGLGFAMAEALAATVRSSPSTGVIRDAGAEGRGAATARKPAEAAPFDVSDARPGRGDPALADAMAGSTSWSTMPASSTACR